MPRFYFDITANGISAPDEDGLLVGTLEDARREAALAIVEIAACEVPADSRQDLQVVICDDEHTPVAQVCLTVCFAESLQLVH